MPIKATPPTSPAPSLLGQIRQQTDRYFSKSADIIGSFGDCDVVYAVFLRRPVLCAPGLAQSWIDEINHLRGNQIHLDWTVPEGGWVGAGDPVCYISGNLHQIIELETLILEKIGPSAVAAYNAWAMCALLPQSAFLAMDARHCTGQDMIRAMAYGASVGSKKAQTESEAIGFIGSSVDIAAPFFGQTQGAGTMPHVLVGYAGSTLRAAQMHHEIWPGEPMTVLVDYFGREISDSIEVAKAFPELTREGHLSVRIDTPSSRYLEGLDRLSSYAVLERRAPDAIRAFRDDQELRYLVGSGVTGAAIWRMRETLDNAGFEKVKLVASSGFNVEKCKAMANVRAPIDVVGTGSYIPSQWKDTYATADCISYGGQYRVKLGREYLIDCYRAHINAKARKPAS